MNDVLDDLEQVPLLAVELVGGALLILVTVGAVVLLYMLLRRRRLQASAPSRTCGLRELGKNRWRSAFARMGTHELDCFSVTSFGLKPMRTWTRGEVEISTPTNASGFVPGIGDPVAVQLTAPGRSEVFELAIERSAYPALRSWTESGPPRPNSVV